MNTAEVHNLSDEHLVKAIVDKNDTFLFGVLYDRYEKMVFNKCYGFANGIEETKDLTQDVFLRVFVKLATFKGTAKFSTWLYAFTYNHCVNYVTRNTAKKIEKKSINSDRIENIGEDVEENTDFSAFKIKKLKKALDLISPDEKMIVLLKYQDNFSIKELADVLELSESAVKMRLKRAKDKLIAKYNTL